MPCAKSQRFDRTAAAASPDSPPRSAAAHHGPPICYSLCCVCGGCFARVHWRRPQLHLTFSNLQSELIVTWHTVNLPMAAPAIQHASLSETARERRERKEAKRAKKQRKREEQARGAEKAAKKEARRKKREEGR